MLFQQAHAFRNANRTAAERHGLGPRASATLFALEVLRSAEYWELPRLKKSFVTLSSGLKHFHSNNEVERAWWIAAKKEPAEVSLISVGATTTALSNPYRNLTDFSACQFVFGYPPDCWLTIETTISSHLDCEESVRRLHCGSS